MRSCIFIYICIITLLFCSMTFASDNRPIIVMREDDGWLNTRDKFPEFGNKSLLEFGMDLKIPITWAVISGRVANGTSLSWQEFIDYVQYAGGELASHSTNHTSMSTLEAYVDDLLQSKAAIQANTPYICNTFIQPGTWTGEAYFNTYNKMDNILGRAIQSNFTQSQLYLLGKIGIGSLVSKHGYTSSFGIDYINRPVTAEFLSAIDFISKTPGAIYVITFHGVQSPTGVADYCTRSDLIASLFSELNRLRNDGKIRLLSINDAYNNNQISPDINRLFDPELEYTVPELTKYLNLWRFSGGTSIVDQIGYNGSKCCRMVAGGKLEQVLFIPSGRYKLAWIQKPDSGTILNDKGVAPMVFAINGKGTQYDVVSMPSYKNTSYAWEEKSITFKIPDKANKVYARLFWFHSGAFLTDNISLKQLDTDPNDCVNGFKVTPLPSGLKFDWKAPNDTQYKYIHIKYNQVQRSPQTLEEGTIIQVFPADNGKEQSFFCPFNWAGKSNLFFSAFAVKQDNTYSEPDVDFLLVDQMKPVITNLATTVDTSNQINASWLATVNNSALYTTMYSVGNLPLSSNIIDWTTDDNSSVILGPLNAGLQYYLNVKAQNVFGVWSDIAYIPFTVVSSTFLSNDDGTTVSLTGKVSAIFDTFYYIQFPEIQRGIRVIGFKTPPTLGATVSVQGRLKTDAGERYIDTSTPGQ